MTNAHLQGSDAALGAIVVSGDHFYRWAPEVVSCSRAIEVVPRAVAEALAEALEGLVTGNYGPSRIGAAHKALREFREACDG